MKYVDTSTLMTVCRLKETRGRIFCRKLPVYGEFQNWQFTLWHVPLCQYEQRTSISIVTNCKNLESLENREISSDARKRVIE